MKLRNSVDKDFPLGAGWTLKETQKFGKKGGARIAKNIVSLLQAFFHAGNANRSDRYSASDMLNELNNMANKGNLEFETIPKLETIQNWIARYSAACKREMADIVLQREEQNNYGNSSS